MQYSLILAQPHLSQSVPCFIPRFVSYLVVPCSAFQLAGWSKAKAGGRSRARLQSSFWLPESLYSAETKLLDLHRREQSFMMSSNKWA